VSRPDAGPLLPGALAALFSGVALALAFPALDWGPLALVALVPLLWSWRDGGAARGALYGFVAGVAFFGILLWWSVYFGVVAIVPLVLSQAAYWTGAGTVAGALARRGVRSPWVVAAIWVVFEAIRTRWPIGGFAWGQVGVALHDVPVARALASWGGVPLVTYAVVLVNGLVLQLGLRWRAGVAPARIARPAAALAGVAVLVAVAAALAYEPARTGSLRFAVLQGNDQDRRLTQAEIDSGYLTRKHLALAGTLRGDYDLIVFPESALETDPEADPRLHAAIADVARRHRSDVMVNVIDEQVPGRRYNANRLYDRRGRLRGTYAKQHLVPFGEYVPWRDQLDFIGELQQVPVDFDPGDETKVLRTGNGHRIGTVICFESAFTPLMRASARAGAEAVVVSTNNRSYRRSPNSAQHVALSQMSAATIGRPVVHAAISGITAVIDADGDVVTDTGLFDSTVVSGRIATVRGETPAVRYGDWVEWSSLVVLLGAVVVAVRRPRIAVPGTPQGGSDE
jgi:apolipoprotein N-acyltransferase